MSKLRIAVVGGGLSGLIAACLLARDGSEVHLYERAQGLGGRARSTEKEGFLLNLGPHALYKAGRAHALLGALGVSVRGRVPPLSGLALYRDEETALAPYACGALTIAERARLSALLARVALGMPGVEGEESVAHWLDRVAPGPGLRAWMEAMIRVSSYSNEPDRMRASRAATQLAGAARGVLYLDGGWQSLVDGLASRAEALGVRLHAGADVRDCPPGRVVLADRADPADAVVLAVAPAVAARLSGSAALQRFAEDARPVRAACLDLALTAAPAPERSFLLGLDAPWYASLHSRTAKLAPEGGAVLHLARYLGAEASGARADLETLADRLQPGWRERVVHARYLPSMIVQESLQPWPSPAVPDAPHLRVAGDWVGPEGLLADAAAGSAEAAARSLAPARAAAK